MGSTRQPTGPKPLLKALAAIVGEPNAIAPRAEHLVDASEQRGVRGRADAVALPGGTEEVASLLAWSYREGVPITVRGGGTGLAGGAVPDGGVVVDLTRMNRVRISIRGCGGSRSRPELAPPTSAAAPAKPA